MLMALDRLPEKSTLLPHCCCPISTSLIRKLASSLPLDPELTLSIGCGSGFAEAHLLRENPRLNLHGLEVSEGINKYLPEERMQIVRGTWDIASSAKDASAWMFIFPREIGLIGRYIQSQGDGKVKHIVWIGPLADCNEVKVVLLKHHWRQGAVEHIGLGSALFHAWPDTNNV